MSRFVLTLASVIILFFNTAQAADYSWSNSTGDYSNPRDACDGAASISYPGWGRTLQSLVVNDDTASCRYIVFSPSDGSGYYFDTSAHRNGSSCPAGSTYNDKTGACDPAPGGKCSPKKGQSSQKMHWLSTTDEPSGEISVDGCAASVKSFLCLTAAPSTYSCTGNAEFTGEELQPMPTGAASDCAGKDCSKDDPQDGTTNDPCIKQDTGAGYTCTSKVEDSKVGETSCGTANGVYVCTPVTKPVKTTISQSTAQQQTANSDGSLTTKNVTTTTKTTCVADKCSSTSYTTTTKGGTTSTGQSVPESSTCTGKGCPSQTGSGGGGGGGNSKDGEQGSADSSSDCSKPPSCDGDEFLCAILDQNFKDSCALRAEPTAKEKAASDQAIQKEVAEVEANQQQMDSDVSGLLSGFKAAAQPGSAGGKCYPDKEFEISGRTVAMPFSKICDPLILLRYAIIAGAYLLAARILTREA
ncbi:virulence factor TspB C-terminal domain-related protein [Pseudomonas sp. UBA1879]|uniref:virulence factor TspB C-terminal domain-related protein n=1 Tax=Pseudomonas sp. UBA1879 TaxID=1947305 RepID=UPI0025F168A3|nr:virulence factor TspB C-terminal domain-related protein [Pseudomonas sp. UBA1879]